ncbi:hypothetical protein Nepgr_015333 [Nepenthes gracilis]|uniref:Glycosyltransferase n=1 Tax=Nepenthes gracilis TaxID=150966 RepID=A0AAD3SLW6_NEPGR|nr:hypothetical protein Nepgr_015333 [Nepenthes gracilis]
MGEESRKLDVILFPFLAHGHMIPMLDIARLFVSRGAKATIITTTLNAPTVLKSIQNSQKLGAPIDLEIFPFSTRQVGLPEGVESFEQAIGLDMFGQFMAATDMLRSPLEQLLESRRPDCLVADMFLPWATDAAAKFDIPRLVFHGTSCFSLCAIEVLRLYPLNVPLSDDEVFFLPHLPGDIKLTRLQIPVEYRENFEGQFKRFMNRIGESEVKSYGVIVNSFYELEPAYADYYRNDLGRRAWHIGPVSLCNRNREEKAQRGIEAAVDEHDCVKWLDSKEPNSVIYICFGSMAIFSSAQLHEIAMALESSGQQFIWVVKGRGDIRENDQEWLPEGFEERMEGKGLIIRGWAPQVMILDHQAIAAFVTHCGWNSILEGISTGVSMVTWPLGAEQFFNEILVTEILKIGIPVGAKEWGKVGSVPLTVKQEAIEKAVRQIMAGEEAEEMRNRANRLKEMALRTVEEGGSSYSDLSSLIEELCSKSKGD